MDFDDRLRNQLHTQSSELDIAREGIDAVRARSKNRQQRRAGGAMLAVLCVAIVGGGWLIGRAGDSQENLATEGDSTGESSDPTVPGSANEVADAIDIENALPEAGASLELAALDNDGAPGGYNVYQNGRSNGLYYVVSTAPGTSTVDEASGVYLRNDTLYVFDGNRWTRSNVADRFVSNFDSSNAGVLYAISTGSPTRQALEVGMSTNAGGDWAWTEIDLTSVFGQDRAAWPPYTVRFATRGNERLVVVHTNDNIDWERATQLAIDGGADITQSSQIMNVDRTGLSWLPEQPQVACVTPYGEAMARLWEGEPGGPEFDYSRELTPQEQAEVDAFYQAQDLRARQIEAEALRSVASIPGCEPFVKCTNQLAEQSIQNTAETQDLLAQAGLDGEYAEFTEEQLITLEAIYAAESERLQAWGTESGCDETLGMSFGEEGMEDARYETATWAELGVTPPSSWNPINNAFLIADGQVADLGDVFSDQTGFLLEVEADNTGWRVTFDTTGYTGQPVSPTYTTWSSTDATTWTSNTSDQYVWNAVAQLADGTRFWVQWEGEGNQLVRVSPDGTTNTLALADLAPGIDTAGFTVLNVKAGEYGVVIWAVNWNGLEGGGNYQSLVAYSPDGIGWGVTEVPDLEVIDAIVGNDGVMFFLNDPNRAEGTPQPIVFGSARELN